MEFERIRQDILDKNPPYLPQLSSPQTLYSRNVMFSKLDFHGHVNNTRYIDWCMDAFPLELHKTNRVQTMIINYLLEVRGLETIKIESDPAGSEGYLIHGIRESDGKAIFRASLQI